MSVTCSQSVQPRLFCNPYPPAAAFPVPAAADNLPGFSDVFARSPKLSCSWSWARYSMSVIMFAGQPDATAARVLSLQLPWEAALTLVLAALACAAAGRSQT